MTLTFTNLYEVTATSWDTKNPDLVIFKILANSPEEAAKFGLVYVAFSADFGHRITKIEEKEPSVMRYISEEGI